MRSMAEGRLPRGVRFVRAFGWFLLGVIGTEGALLVLSILGQVPVSVVVSLAGAVAALIVVLLITAWLTNAWPGWGRRSSQPQPNP